MAKAKKVEVVLDEPDTVDQKFLAIAAMIELLVSGQYGPAYLKDAARDLTVALKGK